MNMFLENRQYRVPTLLGSRRTELVIQYTGQIKPGEPCYHKVCSKRNKPLSGLLGPFLKDVETVEDTCLKNIQLDSKRLGGELEVGVLCITVQLNCRTTSQFSLLLRSQMKSYIKSYLKK